MKQQPEQWIHPHALKVWKTSSIIIFAFLLLIPIGLIVAHYMLDWPIWFSLVSLLLVLLFFICDYFMFIPIRYRRFRYEVTENEVDVQSGIFIIKRTVIPMVRVQHVDTKQGPILRKYQLATVTISTAAGSCEIPALLEEAANELRDRISVLARVVDEDD